MLYPILIGIIDDKLSLFEIEYGLQMYSLYKLYILSVIDPFLLKY